MWNKGLRTVGLITAVSILASGCAGGAGQSISIGPRLAMEHGRAALERARHTVGAQDVTAADVVEAFGDVIAHDSLRNWWRAEVVGESAQISFLMISAEYQRAHPDVTYPLVEAEDAAAGGHGLSAREAVIPASEEVTPTTVAADTDSTDPVSAEQGDEVAAETPGDAETTPTGDQSPVVTIEDPELANGTAPQHGEPTAKHGAPASTYSSEAGALPEDAFEVALAACVREISGEMRVRSGACPTDVPEEEHGSETHASPQWSYEGETGQAAWGSLTDEYATCGAGREQSPIDLTAATKTPLGETRIKYSATHAKASDTGHTLKLSFDLGSSIEINKTLYRLVEAHYHAHSEHTVAGKTFPVEMHFVHKDFNGNLAVVGVLMESGENNDTWAPLLDAFVKAPKVGEEPVGKLNVQQMMPAAPTVYRYAGSLTTPPCSEGVTWSVLTEPVQISPKQIAALQAHYAANARDVQPLGERQLLLDAKAG